MIEDAFVLLKMTIKELHVKFELDVLFLLDVIICYSILHNVLLQKSHNDVKRLLEVLRTEEVDGKPLGPKAIVGDPSNTT